MFNITLKTGLVEIELKCYPGHMKASYQTFTFVHGRSGCRLHASRVRFNESVSNEDEVLKCISGGK
jgi:hypothetical protein